MALSAAIPEIMEYRGIWGLMAAEVLTDNDEDGYTTGEPFAIAAVAEIGKAPDGSSESHYYNNIPGVVIDSEGADTISITSAALSLEVKAKLSGQYFDDATGSWIETPAKKKYFAIGYKTQDTSGNWVYVWRLKGKFSPLQETNSTRDNGTSANNQALVYTGIYTTATFEKTDGEPSKGVNSPEEKIDAATWFDAVVTPDTLSTGPSVTEYSLTITEAADTTVTVIRNGKKLASGAKIYEGDQLRISVEGGTLEVNSDEWFSGDIHVVSGNVTVVSTAS